MGRLSFFFGWKLQWKFLFIFLVLVLVPMLGFSIFIYSQANQAVQEQAIANTRDHLDKVDQNLSAVTQDIEDISSYMIYSEDIRSFLETKDTPENSMRLRNLEEQIIGFTTFHLTSKSYLTSISLFDTKEKRIDIGTPLTQMNEDRWKQNAYDLTGKPYWSDAYTIEDFWGRENTVISLYRVINDINNVSNPLGMVTVRLDAEMLYQLIESDIKDLEQMVILNQNGSVVMHPNSDLIGQPYPKSEIVESLSKNPTTSMTLSYQEDSTDYNAVTQPVQDTDLVVLGIVNEESVAEGINGIQGSIRVMMIVLTVFGILALLGFYHFNIKRIIDLGKQTQQVEKGDFSANVTVTSKDEIGVLGLRFNQMVERLRHLIENEYQMEIQNRESELKLLQSQINPHFLYNTLDMIRWTARMEKAYETSEMIEQLSKMFRISLNRGKPWIILKDELTYSQSYLNLQKRRMGDKLQYTIYYDADIVDAVLLKQTIQPLIENSIHHGFEKKRSLQKIYIRCFRKKELLVLDVIDNGKGFPSGDFQLSAQAGYALQNIQDRLMFAFGSKASIEIKQKHTPGAWVRVTMPYHEKNDKDDFSKSVGELDES
ncbi:histidine kinase [Halobacillus seohaensis]|uniref:Sensor histidine kinase n=1 Tax=Halobacillus seohaensis TaxID=447421 RepID=A0ABW2ER55_9BACI